MSKIELSEREIEIVELQLDEKIELSTATDEEKSVMMGVIDKAEALMDELEAYEESGDDLIQWFYDKYKEQQAKKV